MLRESLALHCHFAMIFGVSVGVKKNPGSLNGTHFHLFSAAFFVGFLLILAFYADLTKN
jgi:hypothetical protein